MKSSPRIRKNMPTLKTCCDKRKVKSRRHCLSAKKQKTKPRSWPKDPAPLRISSSILKKIRRLLESPPPSQQSLCCHPLKAPLLPRLIKRHPKTRMAQGLCSEPVQDPIFCRP